MLYRYPLTLSYSEIIYLDKSVQVHLAVCNCYLCRPRDHHDRATTTRVKEDFSHLLLKFSLTFSGGDRKDKIQWECDNGGQLWTEDTQPPPNTVAFPSGFCAAGFSSLNGAFIGSLLVDLIFQVRNVQFTF